MTNRYRTITWVDYDGQSSTMTVNVPQTKPMGEDIAWNDFLIATDYITRGIYTTSVEANRVSYAPPMSKAVDPLANRQSKWLVTYTDTTEFLDPPTNSIRNPNYRKLFTLEVPTADLSLRVGNSDQVFPAASVPTAITTWITAFESIARSPSGGMISVLRIMDVGRSI